MKAAIGRVEEVNKELWVLLSLFAICLLLNLVVDGQRMVLSFYTLPTLGSAYYYGRRHATLTALGQRAPRRPDDLVQPGALRAATAGAGFASTRWLDITVWGGVLILTGYSMGTLYEHKSAQIRRAPRDLSRRSADPPPLHREGHLHGEPLVSRSVYAATIAMSLNLPHERVEDVRAAALLHDIGKLDVSRELLYKAARLTKEEYEQMKQHVPKGVKMLEPVGGSLRRVIPIVLAHHDKFDGTGLSLDVAATEFRSRRASCRSPTSTIR